MKKIYLAVIALLLSIPAYAQRDTISLNNDWKFVVDKKNEGLDANWFKKDLQAPRKVQLPHTWNIEDENQNHYGWGWYQKTIKIPANWSSKNVILTFGAINHTAYIYVNGQMVAEHIGDGFNKFYVNLTNKLSYGKENIITVACNNDYGKNKVPYANSFDWPNDGGLIRTVAFIVSDQPSVNYIHAVPVLNTSDNSGKLSLKLGFGAGVNKNVKLSVTITEENQSAKNVILKVVDKPSWQNTEALLEYTLPKVNPWHFDFPNLYRIDVRVINGSKVVDHVSTNIGFREIKFANGQTFLNGEHVKLMGVEWTAGSNPDFGFAETKEEIIRHGRLMKDVNCIFSRVHFQQDDAFYDFCDRNGIILQEEVPLWGAETPSNDTIKAIAHKQLEQMISNHFNHPSIFAWGVGNELNGRNAQMKAMIESLVAKARLLDPSRKVSYVSNTLTQGFVNDPKFTPDAGSLGDYVMMNEYGGSWWNIPVGKIHNYLDSVHMSYPDKPFFISEFGLCGPNFKGDEERRLEDLVYHVAVYESKPYVEGAIYFDLTDYRTHYPGTTENNKFRRRVHGIYDMYGKPKPSMKTLREMSSPVEVQQVYQWKKGKLSILIIGSIGLPQHTVKGYKLYLSDKTDTYSSSKAYEIPEVKPGQQIYLEVDDLYDGKGIITVIRPTGFVATQKSFY